MALSKHHFPHWSWDSESQLLVLWSEDSPCMPSASLYGISLNYSPGSNWVSHWNSFLFNRLKIIDNFFPNNFKCNVLKSSKPCMDICCKSLNYLIMFLWMNTRRKTYRLRSVVHSAQCMALRLTEKDHLSFVLHDVNFKGFATAQAGQACPNYKL